MSPAVLDAPKEMGRKKKAPTEPIRIASDVVELAWKVAPYSGYRGVGAAGDFLSELLRPILTRMEAEQRGQSAAPPKKAGK